MVNITSIATNPYFNVTRTPNRTSFNDPPVSSQKSRNLSPPMSEFHQNVNPDVYYKPGIVHKWNISFDGSKDRLNVEPFIYRVEAYASFYKLPPQKLLTYIILIKGQSLIGNFSTKELILMYARILA